jgi:general stress protein 26
VKPAMDEAKKLWDIASRFDVAMLVTHDAGEMRARPLALHSDRARNRFCFLTRASAHKVKEAATENSVCIAMADPAANLFLSISGEANVSKDRALISQLWDEAAAAWFGSGPENPDVAVLVVTPHNAEYWEDTSSPMSKVWQLAVGALGKRSSAA